jgi:hypothetical protein
MTNKLCSGIPKLILQSNIMNNILGEGKEQNGYYRVTLRNKLVGEARIYNIAEQHYEQEWGY